MQLRPLGLLERGELRKTAIDCGFDVVDDEVDWVTATSTHAPLKVWLGRTAQGRVLGLSMQSVFAELRLGSPVVMDPPAPPAACWLAFGSIPALDVALLQAWRLSRTLPNQLEAQFNARLAAISATEREATVKQRIGQDLFRDGLMVLWKGRCAISRLDEPALLRASHAKPWAVATNSERLDVFNGLLLAAHLDAAFDAGFIAVADDGEVLVSSQLTSATLAVLRIDPAVRVQLSPGHVPYLNWHRASRFKQ